MTKYWTGGNDKSLEGTYHWAHDNSPIDAGVNGRVKSKTNSKTANSTDDYDCLFVGGNGKTLFYDDCEQTYGFVCKILVP